MSLERVVRPYQLPDTAPPRVVLSSTDSKVGGGTNSKITIKASPAGKIFHISYSHSVTTYMTKQQKEKKQTDSSADAAFGPGAFNAALSDGASGFSGSDLRSALGFNP